MVIQIAWSLESGRTKSSQEGHWECHLKYIEQNCFSYFTTFIGPIDSVYCSSFMSYIPSYYSRHNHIVPLNAGKVAEQVLLYPILDTRIFVLLLHHSVTLTVPPLDSKTGRTGELWSKNNPILDTRISVLRNAQGTPPPWVSCYYYYSCCCVTLRGPPPILERRSTVLLLLLLLLLCHAQGTPPGF